MQPEVETPPSQEAVSPGLKRSVDLIVSLEEVDKAVQAELKRLAHKTKMPGFRPGKVPIAMVERNHGVSVRQDVMGTQIENALMEALSRDQLRMAGHPDIEPKRDSGSDAHGLMFTATFEVYPDVSLPDLNQVSVTRYQTPLTEANVDQTIEILRKQRATYEVREGRAPQKGDQVKVDFKNNPHLASLDDKTSNFNVSDSSGDKPSDSNVSDSLGDKTPDSSNTSTPEFSAEDFVFILGKGRMLPEFEAAVKGMQVGETTLVSLTFPENYPTQAVAGKTTEVTITLKEVAEPVLPALDAEFAQALGQETGDLEKLKEDVRANLERAITRLLHERNKTSVMEALTEIATFEVPQVLVEKEIDRANTAARAKFQKMGGASDVELPAGMRLSQDEAKQRVCLALLCAEILEQKKLHPTKEQVWEKLVAFSQDYEAPAQLIEHYLSTPQLRNEFEALVTEDNVVAYVLDSAQVVEEEVPFAELMGIAHAEEEDH